MLAGTNVVLGVTGSIAAVKVVELVHELRRRGATVRGVVSESATGIIHPWTVEFATGNEVVTELTGAVEHVEFFAEDGWADVFLVAPATANTVGKMAAAIDDTPVTTCATTALGADIPVVVAPAMHRPMYDHPGVESAIETLESWGVSFVDPVFEEEKAKIAEEETIVLETARAASDRPLEGTSIVVTSGATSEPIDPVRILTNRSSGKTGRAVAKGLYAAGADVTLVHDGPDLPYATVRQVETGAEMIEAVTDGVADADALVSAAAVSDFTVEPAAEKIRSGQELTLSFEPTPKLIDSVRDEYPDLPIVGFKVESGKDSLVERARELQERVGLEFVIGNDTSVMGSEVTSVLIVDGEETIEFEGAKSELGVVLADELAARLQ